MAAVGTVAADTVVGTVAADTAADIISDLALAVAISATAEDAATVTDTIVATAGAASTRTYGRPSKWRDAILGRLGLDGPKLLVVAVDDLC